jgi:hypothetical protein
MVRPLPLIDLIGESATYLKRAIDTARIYDHQFIGPPEALQTPLNGPLIIESKDIDRDLLHYPCTDEDFLGMYALTVV